LEERTMSKYRRRVRAEREEARRSRPAQEFLERGMPPLEEILETVDALLPDGWTRAQLGIPAEALRRMVAGPYAETVHLLRQDETPATVGKAVGRVAEGARRLVETVTAAQSAPAPACRRGCSHCCYLYVGASAAEVFRIADYLRTTRTPAELAEVRRRLGLRRDVLVGLGVAGAAKGDVPCGLLEADGSCGVYPARPLSCAGWASFDADACDRHHRNPAEPLPLNILQLLVFQLAMLGLAGGFCRSGCPAHGYDLQGALLYALDHPTAAHRWMAGEDPFPADLRDPHTRPRPGPAGSGRVSLPVLRPW
jgi:hypothetical protein